MTLDTVAVVAVGDELLGADRAETNSLRLASALSPLGLRLVRKVVVGDEEGEIALAVRQALEVADLVVVTGGLGPTRDDRTREGVAAGLELPLGTSEEAWEAVCARYRAAGRRVPPSARRVAGVLRGAELLPNRRGTAAGQIVTAAGATVVLLPGVPSELEAVVEDGLVPWLAARGRGVAPHRRTLLVTGLPESEVEERIEAVYPSLGAVALGLYPSAGSVRIAVSGDEEAVETVVGELRRRLGDDVAGVDVDGLAGVVLERLRARGETVATAESCTGGLVGGALTELPGASAVFRGGVVAYHDDVKRERLGVERDALDAHGAVSEEVARQMARGVRTAVGSDWGIAVTGIAGPGGGTADKPVGTVHWAVAGPGREEARRAVFPGERSAVRRWSVASALDLLRRVAGEGP